MHHLNFAFDFAKMAVLWPRPGGALGPAPLALIVTIAEKIAAIPITVMGRR